jgi:carnitine O-acetyltransferase
MKINPTNVESFETVRSSIFAVCLDDHSAPSDLDSFHHQIFHNYNAHNRWFDKTIQIVVASSGKAGINGEHTPADAVVPATIMQYVSMKYVSIFV